MVKEVIIFSMKPAANKASKWEHCTTSWLICLQHQPPTNYALISYAFLIQLQVYFWPIKHAKAPEMLLQSILSYYNHCCMFCFAPRFIESIGVACCCYKCSAQNGRWNVLKYLVDKNMAHINHALNMHVWNHAIHV